MICINRSTDLKNETVWVTIDVDYSIRRCKQLYLGSDINGAVAAAVHSGMSRDDAVALAIKARDRKDVNDTFDMASYNAAGLAAMGA